MLITKRNPRRGAHVVEFAAVVCVFLLLLFGILEYCRFVYVRQIMVNAAREGARYAVVNVDDTTIDTDTKNYVKQKMVGLDAKLKNYVCDIYEADANGAKLGAAANAGFGEYVVVQIDADYEPVLPAFLFMGKTIKLRSKALMFSEAN